MDRRKALKSIAMAASGLYIPFWRHSTFASMQHSGRYGWNKEPESLANFIYTHKNPYITQQNEEIKGTGKGKKAFLHIALERAMGTKFVSHDQGAPDCVSHAAALAVDTVSAVQIILQRKPYKWTEVAATEPIYGGSRVEIGGETGSGGGSTGHWAAEWLSRFGVLTRKKYPGGYDFTYYDPNKAVEYGTKGCPDSIEPIAKLHPVKNTAICTSYSDLRDCIYNGIPVMVCSDVGFGNGVCRRDSEGFLNRSRSPWYHAMLFWGYDDEYQRAGALCQNSWGANWIHGPTRGPQPEGSFWIDANTVDSMLRQGDSFAFSGFQGFPRVIIPPYILF